MARPHADTVLLLIDLQKAFCDPDGSMSRQGRDIAAMREAARACGRLAAAGRAAAIPVIWTRMGYRPGYVDGGRLIWDIRPALRDIGALRNDSPDCAISALAEPGKDDLVLDKPRYSALFSTPLESILRSLAVERVIVAGVTTSMCVDTTARDLSQRDYETVVVRDGCGDFDRARHDAALAALAFGFCSVIESSDALAMLHPASPRQS